MDKQLHLCQQQQQQQPEVATETLYISMYSDLENDLTTKLEILNKFKKQYMRLAKHEIKDKKARQLMTDEEIKEENRQYRSYQEERNADINSTPVNNYNDDNDINDADIQDGNIKSIMKKKKKT